MTRLANPEEIVRAYDTAVRDVMNDVTLKREYQVEAIKELYDEAREAIQRQLDEKREDLETKVRVARRIAFQPPPMEGNRDKALLTMLLDHHLDRVYQIDTVNELDLYLQRQLLIDNPVGIKAALIRAFELRASEMVGRILAEYPDWEDDYMAFVEASEELNSYSRSPHAFFGAGGLRPPREYLP